MGRAARGRSEREVLRAAMLYAPFVERYAPELLEEVAGLAEGAGMSYDSAFFLQVATELELEAQGCTALGIERSEHGPFIAQNWDQPHLSRGNQIVLRLQPRGRHEILMFTHAGCVGYIGLNDQGLGVVQNQLYAAKKPMGLTGYFIIRKLFGFDSVHKGLAWLRGVPIGSSGNYILGDAVGSIVDVELGDGRYRSQRRSVQVHTNHYLLRGWLSRDRGADMLPDSQDRLRRLRALLATSADEAAALRALKDHTGYPTSICRHEGAPGLRTTASVLLRLRNREMCLCYGNPCMGRYRLYRLAGDTHPQVALS